MLLPDDHAALAALLPDAPRWVETRALLLAGSGVLTVTPERDGALLRDPDFPSAFVVGRADATLLRDGLTQLPEDFELVVQLDALDDARAVLPDWNVALAPLHTLPRPWAADVEPPADVVIAEPGDAQLLAGMPDDVIRYAAVAEAIAVRRVDGTTVAVCAAGDVTESLWDVGIDTHEEHRRRGHAEACFRALAGRMAAAGRQPIWCAEEDNAASLALAAKLGFEPVDRLAILAPPN